MTEEDLEAIEPRLRERDGFDPARIAVELAHLVAEVRRLRALPVIETCGACASCAPRRPLTAYPRVRYYCSRKPDLDTQYKSPPPSWCPMRKAAPMVTPESLEGFEP